MIIWLLAVVASRLPVQPRKAESAGRFLLYVLDHGGGRHDDSHRQWRIRNNRFVDKSRCEYCRWKRKKRNRSKIRSSHLTVAAFCTVTVGRGALATENRDSSHPRYLDSHDCHVAKGVLSRLDDDTVTAGSPSRRHGSHPPNSGRGVFHYRRISPRLVRVCGATVHTVLCSSRHSKGRRFFASLMKRLQRRLRPIFIAWAVLAGSHTNIGPNFESSFGRFLIQV